MGFLQYTALNLTRAHSHLKSQPVSPYSTTALIMAIFSRATSVSVVLGDSVCCRCLPYWVMQCFFALLCCSAHGLRGTCVDAHSGTLPVHRFRCGSTSLYLDGAFEPLHQTHDVAAEHLLIVPAKISGSPAGRWINLLGKSAPLPQRSNVKTHKRNQSLGSSFACCMSKPLRDP